MTSADETGRSTPVGPRAVRFLFLNRQTGRYTVAQWPNIPLAVFVVLAVVQRLFHPHGTTGTVVRLVAAVALLVWSVDELVRGVNPFRRMLGAVVLIATCVGLSR